MAGQMVLWFIATRPKTLVASIIPVLVQLKQIFIEFGINLASKSKKKYTKTAPSI